MALNRIPCPECGAGLKSPSGFTVGQTVCCPKCETYFAVEKPAEENEEAEENESPRKAKASSNPPKAKAAGKKKPLKATTLPDDDDDDDEEEDRPTKKKKKKLRDDDDDEGRSYKNSPLRFAILGVLIVVMLVLGYFLYDKKIKQNAADKETAKTDTENTTPQTLPVPPGGFKGPNFGPGGLRPPGGPGGRPTPPGVGQLPIPPKGNPNGPVATGGLLSPDPLTDAEKKKLLEKYKAQLIGTWKADLGDGATAQLVYTADGKVTETVTSSKGTQTTMGTWSASSVTDRKSLLFLVVWSGMKGTNKPLELVFEDDELQHPVLGQGVIGVFRKS